MQLIVVVVVVVVLWSYWPLCASQYMSSSNGIISVLLQALQEVVLRQTVLSRDRWVAVHRLKKNPVEVDDMISSNWFKRYRAELLLSEMYAEEVVVVVVVVADDVVVVVVIVVVDDDDVVCVPYIAILAAPTMLILCSTSRIVCNYGYSNNDAVDISALMMLSAVQITAELDVDVICCHVEQRIMTVPVDTVWKKWMPMSLLFCTSMICWCAMYTGVVMVSFGIAFRSPCRRYWEDQITFVRVCEPACLQSVDYSVLQQINYRNFTN